MIVAVTGKPIAHSVSPQLHRAGMDALGITGSSFRIIADTGQEALRLGQELGLRGLNVTAPFKEEIASLVTSPSAEVKSVAALNTVVFEQQSTVGYNTDIYGISESLRPYIADLPPHSPVLVLGAGGAAKAACQSLQQAGFLCALINRSRERVTSLAGKFKIPFCTFDDPEHIRLISNAKIIVNTLSTLERPFSSGLIHAGQIILDAHYKEASEIAIEAQACGARLINGLDWLIHQGREAQRIFFGSAPEYQILKSALTKLKQPASIAFIGLMGVGKTEIGKGLAQKLDRDFVDLDTQIELSAGKSIAEIFESQGEPGFRSLESDQLKSLSNLAPHVLSCGGGLVLDKKNREFLRENYRVVWLVASLETLQARLQAASAQRPLLKDSNIATTLGTLWLTRREVYAASADLVMSSDTTSQEKIIQRIYDEVR